MDGDCGACLDTRKSTLEYVFMLNGAVVWWSSHNRSLLSEVRWKLSKRLATRQRRRLCGCAYNSVCIKHIDIAYHVVRERVLWGHVAPAYVICDEDIADVFTEPLVNAKLS